MSTPFAVSPVTTESIRQALESATLTRLQLKSFLGAVECHEAEYRNTLAVAMYIKERAEAEASALRKALIEIRDHQGADETAANPASLEEKLAELEHQIIRMTGIARQAIEETTHADPS